MSMISFLFVIFLPCVQTQSYLVPSNSPTDLPSNLPSDIPSGVPSIFPSIKATNKPSLTIGTFPTRAESLVSSSSPTCYTLDNDWYLEFLEATKVSDGNLMHEVTVRYLVNEGQESEKLKAKILDENCGEFVDNNAVYVEECYVKGTPSKCADEGNVNVGFSDNRAIISSSPLWQANNNTYGCLDFCVKAELVNYVGLSVSFENVLAKICMSLDPAATNFMTPDIEVIPRTPPGIRIDPFAVNIEAFVCEADLTPSFFSRAYQNSKIRICLKASNDGDIVALKNVKFYQDGVEKFTAINSYGTPYPGLVSFTTGPVAVLHVQLISAYFEEPVKPLTVTGLATLDSDIQLTISSEIGFCC